MNFAYYGYNQEDIIDGNAIDFCNDDCLGSDRIKKTWELMQRAEAEIIIPNIGKIRTEEKNTKKLKLGSDFFTIIDTQVEELLTTGTKKLFYNDITIIGEEYYQGEHIHQGRYSMRIDPIDGTTAMKYGSNERGIMAGLYEHTDTYPHQIAGLVYFPEIEGSPLIVRHKEKLWISNTKNNTSILVGPSQESNTIHDAIVDVRYNTHKTSSPIDKIISRVKETQISIQSSNVELEGLLMKGKRIKIIDQGPGGYGCRDFIPYSFLQLIGYKIYKRDGLLVDADDPSLVDHGLICVPPGILGQTIRQIVMEEMSEIIL